MSNWERVRLRIETLQDLSENKTSEVSEEKTISTHILDTSKGQAARDVTITVFKLANDSWELISQAQTNIDGRVSHLLTADQFQGGVYKLKFDVHQYFQQNRVKSFYPFIEIVIECEPDQHYHVPLLLNPFGYSTYRGT